MVWMRLVATVLALSFFTSTSAFSFDFQGIVDSALTFISDNNGGKIDKTGVDMDAILARFRKSVDEVALKKLKSFRHAYRIEAEDEEEVDDDVHSRNKRHLPETLHDVPTVSYRVTDLAISFSNVGNASEAFDLFFFGLGGEIYGIVGLETAGGKATKFVHVNASNGDYTILETLQTPDTTDYAVVHHGNFAYVVVLRDSTAETDGVPAYTKVLKFDPNSSPPTSEIQRLYTPGGTTLETFHHYHLGKTCIAIAEAFREIAEDLIVETRSSVYCWEGAYFDEFADFETSAAHNVKPFYFHNRLYLAVANYMNSDGEVSTDSVILEYDQHERLFLPHQYIPTEGAVDWEAFTFGSGHRKEHFLAVANGPTTLRIGELQTETPSTVNSVIYKYSHGQFVPFQCIPTTGAKKWVAHSGPNGEFVLALLDASGVTLYEYDGWRFVPAPATPNDHILTGATALKSKPVNGVSCQFILNPTLPNGYSIFEYEFNATYDVQNLRGNATEECNAANDRLDSAIAHYNSMNAAADNLVYITSTEPQVITGHKTFTDDVNLEQTSVHQIQGSVNGLFDNSDVYTLNEIKQNITTLQQKISEIDGILENTLKVNEDQTVTGVKSFQTVVVTNLQVGSTFTVLNSETVNDRINLTDLSTNVFTKNQNHDIYTDMEFDDGLVFQGNLVVGGLLDGHDPDNFVTLDGDQTLTAKQIFTDAVTFSGPLDVQGTVDGVTLTPSSVLLTNDDGTTQVVTGDLSFNGGLTFNLVGLDGTVDGVDLSAFKDEVVTLSGDHNITGAKTFTGPVVVEGSLTIENNHLIDGVQVDVLDTEVLKKSGAQQISGTPTFTTLAATAGITVDGTVDGLSIPDDVLLISQNATIAGNVVFAQDATFAKLQVDGAIDGINTDDDGSLDVMTLSGTQNVSATKNFTNGIAVDVGITFTSGTLIDGVDVSEMAANSVDLHSTQTITGSKTFSGNFTINGVLDSQGGVNGIDASMFSGNTVKLSDGYIRTLANIEFSADTRIEADLITNNQHLIHGCVLSDFTTQGQTETIDGFKTFTSDVGASGNVQVSGLVNGCDLYDTKANAWMLAETGTDVTVAGYMTFAGGVVLLQDLNVTGLIDGISLSDAVTVFGEQTISGATTFLDDVEIDDLTVNADINIDGTINGLDASTLDSDTLKITGAQTLTGHKTFVNQLNLESDLTVDGTINTVDLAALYSDAVTIDGTQDIGGNKTFTAVVNVATLDVTGTIDGVDVETFASEVVTMGTAQNISGVIVFDNDVQATGNITVHGNINDIDVLALDEQAVRVTDSTFDVNMTFSNVVSGGNVLVSGTVDGVDIAEDTITTGQLDVIDGSMKTFQGDVSVQSLTIDGTIDGVDINLLDASAVKISGDQNITVSKTFEGTVEFQSNVYVGGTAVVDGVDVEDFADNAMKVTAGVTQTVTGSMTFSDVDVLQPAVVTGLIDGVDITVLNNTYMSLTQDQEVTGTKVFYEEVIIRKNLTANVVDVEGFLNGVDFTEWTTTVLLVNGAHTINSQVVFMDDVTVRGNVAVVGLTDGIALSVNLMLANADNVITGHKNLSDMVVSGNLNMGSGYTVNDIDVSDWSAKIVHVYDSLNISDSKTFSDIVIQGNLSVAGDIDGIEVSTDNLLTITREQIITGVKNFSNEVYFDGNLYVLGTINGIYIEDLKNNTLFIVGDQTMKGDVTLTQTATLRDVYANGKVNNIDINALYRDIYNHSSIDEFRETLEVKCQMMDDIHEAAEDVAIFLGHFEEVKAVTNQGEAQWGSFVNKGIQKIVMISKRTDLGCLPAPVYQWNSATEEFEEDSGMTLNTIGGMELVEFYFGGRQYLIIANGKDYDPCQDNFVSGYSLADVGPIAGSLSTFGIVQIAVWNETSDDYTYYQGLKSKNARDVEAFVHPESNRFCIAIANHMEDTYFSELDSFVYCMTDFDSGFECVAEFQTSGASKIKHFVMNGNSYLAVASRYFMGPYSVAAEYTTDSVVLEWDGNNYVQFDTMITHKATDVLPINISGVQYVILTQESVDSGDTIHIYSYNNDSSSFDWVQGISAFSPRTVEHLKIQHDDYLFIADGNKGFYVYKVTGISLFTLDKFIKVANTQNLYVFEHANTGDLYAATGTLQSFQINPYIPPIILQSDQPIFRGRTIGSYTPSIGCTD